MNRVTGNVESTTNSSLKFVDSPFELRWDKTLQYFKIGFTFDVKVNNYQIFIKSFGNNVLDNDGNNYG